VYETRMPAFEKERAIAEAAAREAGAIVQRYYDMPIAEVAKSDKGAGRDENWLTQADSESDELLKARLLGAFPDYGWLSEETKDDPARLGCDIVWVVDPIDGTREFVEGIPEWCVSIGLVRGGVAVAGGIVNPASGERIVGAIGTGVRYEGSLPEVMPATSLHEASILASRSEVRRGEWEAFLAAGLNIIPMGSIAYKLALVGAGRADVTWTLVPKHEWDVAAGVAIVNASGRSVVDRGGRPITFNRPVPRLDGLIAADEGRLKEALAATRAGRGPGGAVTSG